jgi:hypothetical protein
MKITKVFVDVLESGAWTGLMDGSDLFPHDAGFPPAITDITEVSPDSADLRLVADATQWERLPGLTCLERLWCFRINKARMAAIARSHSLKRLYLDGIRTPIDALRDLKHLVVLSLASATRLASLEEIPVFEYLEGLAVINAPKVGSLGPLQERSGLEALAVSGGIWSRMTVDTLEPLRGLSGLRYLDLQNLKVLDASLEPLEGLTELRTLELPNFYPVEEFARLASRLKQTTCAWFSPAVDLPSVPCRHCGEMSMVVLTGKGLPMLCTRCDDRRVRKHADLFQSLMASSA